LPYTEFLILQIREIILDNRKRTKEDDDEVCRAIEEYNAKRQNPCHENSFSLKYCKKIQKIGFVTISITTAC
jgi:hypothetical protein